MPQPSLDVNLSENTVVTLANRQLLPYSVLKMPQKTINFKLRTLITIQLLRGYAFERVQVQVSVAQRIP